MMKLNAPAYGVLVRLCRSGNDKSEAPRLYPPEADWCVGQIRANKMWNAK